MTLDELIAAETDDPFEDSPRYAVTGYPGVAFWFAGPQVEDRIIEPDWSTLVDDNGNPMDADVWWPDENDVDTVPTGLALMVMVGDDYRHVVDPDDVTLIAPDAYCGVCGQIGCRW